MERDRDRDVRGVGEEPQEDAVDARDNGHEPEEEGGSLGGDPTDDRHGEHDSDDLEGLHQRGDRAPLRTGEPVHVLVHQRQQAGDAQEGDPEERGGEPDPTDGARSGEELHRPPRPVRS